MKDRELQDCTGDLIKACEAISVNTRRLVQALLLVVIVVPVISGCKRDPLLDDLKHLKEEAKRKGYSAVEQRYELAISKWKNRTVDREPILIDAGLGKSIVLPVLVGLITFDEDMDVFGIGINEECADVNGIKTTLTEEYPAFVHRMKPEMLDLRLFPVQIRDAGQRKNTQRWDEYVKGEGIDVNDVRVLICWRETLPPVWVSIPEPNTVDVYVYIYDQAGHKSNPIKLLTPDSIPVSFTNGMSYSDFASDKKTVNAVIRSLEVIGEAAKNLPSSSEIIIPIYPGSRWRVCVTN